MQRSLDELKKECVEKNLLLEGSEPGLDWGKKWGKREYIQLLQNESIRLLGGPEALSWGMKQRLKLQSPMLCFAFKNLKPTEKETCMNSDRWLADRKIDGCRMIMTYIPEEGFGFFSRNLSVKDYLPVDYTDKILVWSNSSCLSASAYKGCFTKSFVLDCEAVCESGEIDTTLYRGKQGSITGTELNAASVILSIETEDSHKIQKDQAKLKLVVFDLISFDGKDFTKEPLFTRIIWRDKLVNKLIERGLEISVVDSTIENKQEFYDQIRAEGGEGIVLKQLDSPYISTESRLRTGFVKRKRSMEESKGADIDAYISGFVPSNPEKSWSHLIGAIEMSVTIIGEDGSEEEKVIASVSSMPLLIRQQMTTIDSEGKPCLKKEYMGQVLVINGQDVSPKSLRFMHATADWKRGFRSDKSSLDCKMEKQFILSQVL